MRAGRGPCWGRKGGRKPKLTDAQAAEVRRLYEAKDKTVAEIGDLFGITRESVYRYVNPPKKDSDSQNALRGRVYTSLGPAVKACP